MTFVSNSFSLIAAYTKNLFAVCGYFNVYAAVYNASP